MLNINSFPRLEQFLGYLQAIKGRSVNTIKEYHYDLALFFRFLLVKKENLQFKNNFNEINLQDIDDNFLQNIQLSDLYSFISWLSDERKNGPAARSRRISSIRTFFNYLKNKQHVLEENIAQDLEAPKHIKRLPKHLSLDESFQLLAVAAENKSKWNSRDYCILTLFLNCGLRLAELCSINIPNIKEDLLTVIGKGDKERTIYLNATCLKAISAYLVDRPKISGKDKDALFLSRFQKRISRRRVQELVQKYIILSGLDPKRYTTHKLRHTAATLMYQYGEVDIRSLQFILGHESISTTEIYTHISNSKLHEAIENNPLNFEDKSKQD